MAEVTVEKEGFVKRFLRGIIEGLGGRTIALAIFAPLVALAAKWGLRLDLAEIATVLAPVIVALLKLWHLDVTTGGKTTTHAVMLDRLAKTVAAVAPDHTIADKVAKAIDAAIPDSPEAPPSNPS